MEELAQDKRTYDQDGRMHVRCRISKANVCAYLGREIPNHAALGLQPDRFYRMYRDPAALAEAVDSFNNVPLTTVHEPVNADTIDPEIIAGTVSNASFEHPYLWADVTAWTREAIDGIEDESKKELSCAYRYVAVMIAGTSPDGVGYDGRMVGPIRANHVALVSKGRAGPDVVVADEAPRMSAKTRFPKLMAVLARVVGRELPPEDVAAMDSALVLELGADAFPELSEDERKAACDAAMKELGKDSLTDEEERAAYQRAAKDKAKPAQDAAPAPKADPVTVAIAFDEAQLAKIQSDIDAAVATAREGYVLAADSAAAVQAVHDLYAARAAVEDKVGEVALDSAEAVYRFALDHLKVAHKDVPASALAALYASTAALPLASDAAPKAEPVDVAKIFPGLSFIRR